MNIASRTLRSCRRVLRPSFTRTSRVLGCTQASAGFATFQSFEEKFQGAQKDEHFNIPAGVQDKIGRGLLHRPEHPLGILWNAIKDHFSSHESTYHIFQPESPVVNTKNNFDELLVPPDHVSRSPSDTYYVNRETVLRTHTSAHQCELLRLYPKVKAFLCAGDVFRRDEIDASHYPVFHQAEGVKLFSANTSVEEVATDLKTVLEELAGHLFGLEVSDQTMRWNDEYFPFTHPSYELEVFYNGAWLEVLGCGVIHEQVLRNADLDPDEVRGWAFGLGLERLAMVLFEIPDIRLFWSTDSRFANQFTEKSFEQKTKFAPFSKYPPVLKDMSMWVPEQFFDNDLYEVVRDEGGDRVELVQLIDSFTHPKTKRQSKAFRVIWRDMSRTLTNEEVNESQARVVERVVNELGVEMR